MTTLVLGLDTAGPWVALALLNGREVLADRVEEADRGQAERLIPLIHDVLAASGLALRDLDLIAVGTGPGNFTGVRIGVASARGLALGLGIPAMGVTAFAALRGPDAPARQIVALEGPRGALHVQIFADGEPSGPPRITDSVGTGLGDIADPPPVLGAQADLLAAALGTVGIVAAPPVSAVPLARVALARWLAGDRTPPRPAPVYVRPPDAALPAEPSPVLLP